MQNRRFLKNTLLLAGLALFASAGCATDNEYIAKLPLFESYSDKIPGLTSPVDRVKLIRLKGEKGATAPDSEKELLVADLMVEYQRSPDPNMRREAVDALAKIPYPKRDQYMKEILKDDDPFVRISVLEAISGSFNGERSELAEILIDRMKRDPDKDVRLTAVRLLGERFSQKANGGSADATVFEALAEGLYDKIPAVRYESMQSLCKVTGKDYGSDINRWIQYVLHVKGESPEPPKERTFAEKLPRIQLPMLK